MDIKMLIIFAENRIYAIISGFFAVLKSLTAIMLPFGVWRKIQLSIPLTN